MSRNNQIIGERSIARFIALTNRFTSEIQTVLNYREQLQVEVSNLQDQVETLRAQLVNLRERIAQEQDDLDLLVLGGMPIVGH